MTQTEVMALCRDAGAAHGLDPLLLCAIAEQESSYKSDEMRLENDFYRRYTRPMCYPPSVEGLLAISYGLMQTMGESLREMDCFKAENTAIVGAYIDAYVANPILQIDTGTRWFKRKLKAAEGDVRKALLYWNGGSNKNYPIEVLARRDRMKTEATK